MENDTATHSSPLARESHEQRSLTGYSPWLQSRTRPSTQVFSTTTLNMHIGYLSVKLCENNTLQSNSIYKRESIQIFLCNISKICYVSLKHILYVFQGESCSVIITIVLKVHYVAISWSNCEWDVSLLKNYFSILISRPYIPDSRFLEFLYCIKFVHIWIRVTENCWMLSFFFWKLIFPLLKCNRQHYNGFNFPIHSCWLWKIICE